MRQSHTIETLIPPSSRLPVLLLASSMAKVFTKGPVLTDTLIM